MTTRRQRITDAIQALQDRHGRVTAELVVKAARKPTHPLHKEFQWNDKKAAHANRLDRANELIRFVTVVVVHQTHDISVPFYVRDPMQKSSDAGMISLTSDLIDKRNATKIMLNELDRCAACVQRARGVVGQLDSHHPGLSDRLEQLLRDLVDARDLLVA